MLSVQLVQLGRLAYSPALGVQHKFVQKLHEFRQSTQEADTPQGFLLAVEHEPVYTVGLRDRRGYRDQQDRLRSLGADYVETDRGGLITFHGPGQMVIYPILDLTRFIGQGCQTTKAGRVMGMRWYVHTLEQSVMDTLAEFQVETHRSPHTGVWTQIKGKLSEERKICAMGVHSKDRITSHGLALNCDVDLAWFNHIVPCGIQGKGVTSLTQILNRQVTIQSVLPYFIRQFEKNFKCSVRTQETDDVSVC